MKSLPKSLLNTAKALYAPITSVEESTYTVVTGVISDAEAVESGMIRCSRCSQEQCATSTIKNNSILRWCGRYTAGTKRGRV